MQKPNISFHALVFGSNIQHDYCFRCIFSHGIWTQH